MYVAVGLGRADEGTGGGRCCRGWRSRSTWSLHRELRRVTRDDDPARDRRSSLAIVVPWYAALYRAARLDLHRVVPGRREPRALHVGRRRQRQRPRAVCSTCRSSSATRFPGRSCCSGRVRWPRDRRAGDAARPGDPGCARCSGAGSLAIVGFFSLSAGKQDLYIFPIVPAVAALGGVAIARGLVGRRAGAVGRA